jgi:hypothetical protein
MKRLLFSLLFFWSLGGCDTVEPVMTLHDKHLSTIKKAVAGKWKVYYSYLSGYVYDESYPENDYIEYKDNACIRTHNGNTVIYLFEWRKLPFEEGGTAYVMWDANSESGNYFHSITNDTLKVERYGNRPRSGSLLVRVKK